MSSCEHWEDISTLTVQNRVMPLAMPTITYRLQVGSSTHGTHGTRGTCGIRGIRSMQATALDSCVAGGIWDRGESLRYSACSVSSIPILRYVLPSFHLSIFHTFNHTPDTGVDQTRIRLSLRRSIRWCKATRIPGGYMGTRCVGATSCLGCRLVSSYQSNQ